MEENVGVYRNPTIGVVDFGQRSPAALLRDKIDYVGTLVEIERRDHHEYRQSPAMDATSLRSTVTSRDDQLSE